MRVLRFTLAGTVWPLTVMLLLIGLMIGVEVVAQGKANKAAKDEARLQAVAQTRALQSDLQKYRLLPLVLTEFPEVAQALSSKSADRAIVLNKKLGLLASRTGAQVIYVVDNDGRTIAASNAGRAESFVGREYRFRPYFTEAMAQGASEYFAIGNVTGRFGLFLARRVGTEQAPLGVVVVKVEFEDVMANWRSARSYSFITDRNHVILIASDPTWLFRTTQQLDDSKKMAIAQSQQFGSKALELAPFTYRENDTLINARDQAFVLARVDLPESSWQLTTLIPLAPALETARARARFAGLCIALALGAALALIYWQRTREQRRLAEQARLEEEVAKRTEELSQANLLLKTEGEQREIAVQRFREARDALAQANRLGSIGTITASVAHEINQPVAAIRTLAENADKLLKRGNAIAAVKNIDTIIDLTSRIGLITAELRRYAKRGKLIEMAVDLYEVFESTLILIGDSFKRARVQLDWLNATGPLPYVFAGRGRVEQVLVNLLQNALDAVAKKTSPRVQVSVFVTENYVTIRVDDNGDGLRSDIVDSIFMPFVTGKESGMGLGLGISRDIVREYGGELDIATSQLGGAAFDVRLKRAEGHKLP